MIPGFHTINREVFEMECAQTEHAFQLRARFDHEVQRRLNQIVESVCNELAPGNEVLRIPLLEIDLGEIRFSRFEEDIVTAFGRSFSEKLSELKIRHTVLHDVETIALVSPSEIAAWICAGVSA